MFINISQKLAYSAKSIVEFDYNGCREIARPGPLQGWSGLIVLCMFIILGLSVASYGMLEFMIQVNIMYFSYFMCLFLTCLVPEMKESNPLELTRWIYRHIFWYTLLIIVTLTSIFL